jgi:hypothetical protein
MIYFEIFVMDICQKEFIQSMKSPLFTFCIGVAIMFLLASCGSTDKANQPALATDSASQSVANITESSPNAAATPAFNLQQYSGMWIDTKFNQYECDECKSAIDIQINQDNNRTGTITITLYNTYQILVSNCPFQLNDANQGQFDITGNLVGTGKLIFQEDSIDLEIQPQSGGGDVVDFYSTKRTFVRNPYQDATYSDAIDLVKAQIDLPTGSKLILESSSEEFGDFLYAGKELEVVDVQDRNGVLLTRYIVNTIKNTVTEKPLIPPGVIADDSNYAIKIGDQLLTITDSEKRAVQLLGKPKKLEPANQLGEGADTFSEMYGNSLEFDGLTLSLLGMTESEMWISELEVTTNKYPTSMGIKVGDTVENLQKAYPNIYYRESASIDEPNLEMYEYYQDFYGYHAEFMVKDNIIQRINMYFLFD